MSRLATMSAAALRAVLSQETSDDLVVLLTLTGAGIVTPIRLADNFVDRLSETDDEVVYGVTSRGNDYVFAPIIITLPSEQQHGAMSCQVTIHDVRREIISSIRNLTGAPSATIEIVLKSTPDTIEASFPSMYLGSISYNAGAITGVLSYEAFDNEPFPAHTFTPSYFPGLF